MERVVSELRDLARDVESRGATVRERTAAGGFLAQFYMGVENILKRIAHYHDVRIPRSAHWHMELFDRFAESPEGALPPLFDAALARALKPYREFRHLVRHGYGFDLDWARMKEGIEQAGSVFERFRERVVAYLKRLPPS